MAQAKRIIVSLPNHLLQEVDGIVRRETGNRSAFIREAVLLLIEQRNRKEQIEKCRIGYERMGKLNLVLAEEGFDEDSQAFNSYENYLVKRK